MTKDLKEWQTRSRREVQRLRQMRVRVLGKIDMDDLFTAIPETPTWETILLDFIEALQELPEGEQKDELIQSTHVAVSFYKGQRAKLEPYILELYEQIEKLEQQIATNTADQLIDSGVFEPDNLLVGFLRENDIGGMLESISQGGK
jgi:hypothetical protein